MSTWTWTYVRIDKLTAKQIKSTIEHAKDLLSGTTYANYSKMSWDEAIQKWLDFHKEHYDYFVNECDVPKEKMTDEYLTEDLKNKMELYHKKVKCYDMCINGKMSFEDMLKETNQLGKRRLGDFLLIERDGQWYVHIAYEIFRNRLDSLGKEFCTVDELIEYLKQPDQDLICDFSKEGYEYSTLTPELEQRIRDYYTEIGDYNFYVHFG